MKTILMKNSCTVPAIAIGCMRISNKPVNEVEKLIETALENEINFFDHADIYGGGMSESIFAKAANNMSLKRENYVLQTKCGIRPGICFDFSYEHIMRSVENSLKRLNTEYVDYLLLHRPDTLMEPSEVAKAFAELKKSGKVRCFGVSNFNPMQIELLNQAADHAVIIDQLQFGPAHTGIINSGIYVNMHSDNVTDFNDGILEYCRLNGITIQAWSPFQYGMFRGVFMNNPDYAELVKALDELAQKYAITREAAIVAWISRHPANIQTILGTTNPDRVAAIAKAGTITISREEWYKIYTAAGNPLP